VRILLTGGAGFIGSHLCDLLLENGHEVICMDNLITGDIENVKKYGKDKAFSFVNHNVSDYIDIQGKLDYILHFASPASPVDYLNYPIPTLKAGSLGTHNTLGVALAKKAKYLLASTSEVYGDPLVSPQKEDYWGNVNQIGPRGVYDEAKRFAESMTMAYHRFHNVDAKIARIFNTYGPRMRKDDGRAVPNFVDQALKGKPLTIYGKGTQTRSFCYVSDLVSGIYKLMMSNVNGPVNIGNPDEITIKKLSGIILDITGSKSKLVYKGLPQDDPKVRCPDISLAKKKLDWKPTVSLEEGLKKTLEWARAAF
jgi:dTDP-glucose 4,6-dehydratase